MGRKKRPLVQMREVGLQQEQFITKAKTGKMNTGSEW